MFVLPFDSSRSPLSNGIKLIKNGSILKQDMNLLQACLRFLKRLSKVEAVVIGVTARNELMSIISAWSNLNIYDNIEVKSTYAWTNVRDLDPRHWPKQ